MDYSEDSWLSEMGLDNPFLMDNQCDHHGFMMEYSLDTCPSASSTLIHSTHSPNSNFMGLDNPFLMDNQCDHGFMEYLLDEEIDAVHGQDLDTRPSAASALIHSTHSPNSMEGLHIMYNPLLMDNECYHGQLMMEYSEIADADAVLRQDLDSTNIYEPPPHINNIEATNNSADHPIILNFSENLQEEKTPTPPPTSMLNPEEEAAVSEVLRSYDYEQPNKAQPARVRPPSQANFHIVSERKRRKHLNQAFLALSTVVPGLKKMDKVSVLGEAIKYMKHLQERAKTLEKQSMESVVLVEKSHHVMAEEEQEDVPEIEATVCKSQLLLRVHCQREEGVLVNILASLENLNLSVVNTNVNPFGSLSLDVTVVAKMEKEFNMTVKEVVKRLRETIRSNYKLKMKVV